MLESIIEFLSQVPWIWVLVIAFLTTFTENVFPPSPGDSLLIFMGTLIGIKSGSFVEILLASTLGSTVGFGVMYYLGKEFDHLVMDEGKFRFISREAIRKVETWFARFGYWLIIANRFLSGTRAVISFFAGMSRLNFTITIVLSVLSSLVWNTILLYFGYSFGDNWQVIDSYLSAYGKIIFPIVLAALVIWAIYQFYYKNRKNGSKAIDNK